MVWYGPTSLQILRATDIKGAAVTVVDGTHPYGQNNNDGDDDTNDETVDMENAHPPPTTTTTHGGDNGGGFIQLPSTSPTATVPNLCAICLDAYSEGETLVWSSNQQCHVRGMPLEKEKYTPPVKTERDSNKEKNTPRATIAHHLPSFRILLVCSVSSNPPCRSTRFTKNVLRNISSNCNWNIYPTRISPNMSYLPVPAVDKLFAKKFDEEVEDYDDNHN
jgi:hypothetical protein